MVCRTMVYRTMVYRTMVYSSGPQPPVRGTIGTGVNVLNDPPPSNIPPGHFDLRFKRPPPPRFNMPPWFL